MALDVGIASYEGLCALPEGCQLLAVQLIQQVQQRADLFAQGRPLTDKRSHITSSTIRSFAWRLPFFCQLSEQIRKIQPAYLAEPDQHVGGRIHGSVQIAVDSVGRDPQLRGQPNRIEPLLFHPCPDSVFYPHRQCNIELVEEKYYFFSQ